MDRKGTLLLTMMAGIISVITITGLIQSAFCQTVLEWEHLYIPPDTANVSRAMAVSPDGNVYITGSSVQVTPVFQGEDYLTIKYDTQGDFKWENRYRSSMDANDRANDIFIDDDGYVYVTGFSEEIETFKQFTTIKYHPDGPVEWTAYYNSPIIYDFPNNDEGKHIFVDKNGYVYVTGSSYFMNPSAGNLYYNTSTVKYSPDGELIWSDVYGSEQFYDDRPVAIAVNHYGQVFIAAVTTYMKPDDATPTKETGTSSPDKTSNYDTSEIVIMMYGPGGDLRWVDRYSSSEESEDWLYSLIVDDDGNAYVSGYQKRGMDFDHELYIAKYDTSGTKLWTDVVSQMNPSSGGGYYHLLLHDNSSLYAIGEDSEGNLLVKYDLDGNVQWKSHWIVPSGGVDTAALDHDGNIYAGVDIWLGPDHSPMSFMIAKFDPAGEQIWETTYETTIDTANGLWSHHDAKLGLDQDGSIYIAGTARRSSHSPNGQRAYFAAKLQQTDETSAELPAIDLELELHQNYPNPFNPSTTIGYNLASNDHVTLKIYDILGREIMTLVNSFHSAGRYHVPFDASGLSGGQYFYILRAGDHSVARKMLLIK